MTDIIKLMAVNLHRYEWNRWVRDGVPPEEQHWMGAARACLTALSEAGWCVVPKVPTVAMENAGVSAAGQQGYIAANEGETNAIWSAMVAAGRGEG